MEIMVMIMMEVKMRRHIVERDRQASSELVFILTAHSFLIIPEILYYKETQLCKIYN